MKKTVFVEELAPGERKDIMVDSWACVLTTDEIGSDHRTRRKAVNCVHRIIETLILQGVYVKEMSLFQGGKIGY